MNTDKEWIIRAPKETMDASDAVRQIAEELHLSRVTAQLLVNRDCTTVESAFNFLAKKEEMFHDPFALCDMEAAAETVLSAVEQEQKIAIYGDYDVDGVTSVSALYLYLSELGADVSYYIPCRLGEGYGMSEAAVRRLAEDGVQTIITVDTGVTAVHEARIAAELGVTLVITDHHECCGELPQAAAVVNPHRPDDSYPFKELAGVGVVFKLLCAIESLRAPDDTIGDCVRRICMAYMDLIAIGTIADVMPLCDENRLIVALGLRMIENSPREGVRALLDAAGSESKSSQTKKKITSSTIGFTVAPRLNAAGRIQDASIAVQLFLAQDAETADPLAHRLCDINRQRQNEENKIVDAAYARIDSACDLEKNPVIVLEDEHWHHGVIGIVSSRITDRYACPSILISFEPSGAEESAENRAPSPDDLGKGSGRSIKGLNLVDALSYCAPLLEKFGGHEMAAGLTIRRDKLDAFREKINEYARAQFAGGVPAPVIEVDCELTAQDLTIEQAEQLYALEPYGVSNPTPVFVIYSMCVNDISAVGAGKHLRLRLEKDGVTLTAMYFRHGYADIDIYPGDQVDVLFQLDVNEFQGNRSVQMIVRDIRLAEAIRVREDAEHEIYNAVCMCMTEERPLRRSWIALAVPERTDCAAVYTQLKREICLGHQVYSIRAMQHLLRGAGVTVTYTKLTLILAVFGELGILRVEEVDPVREVYQIGLNPNSAKTSLDRSLLLQRLRKCAESAED